MNDSASKDFLLEPEHKVYKYRFVISLFYFLSSALNGIMFICYSPVITIMSKIYGESLSFVTFGLNLIWLVMYPPVNFISNYVLDTFGLRAGVLLGNCFMLLGLWVRTFCQGPDQFYYIFLGQFLGSIGQPFIIGAPQKVSAVWYPPSERTMSTAILSTANSMGIGVGIFLTQIFVSNDPEGQNAVIEVYNLSTFHAILATVLLTPAFVFFKSKPPTPPSKGAEAEKFSYTESLKSLWENKNYKIFLVAASMIYASFNVLSIVIDPFIRPFGFSSSNAGNLGGVTLLFGLIGTITVGIYANKTKALKKTILFCSAMSVLSLGGMIGSAMLENIFALGACFALYGFFTTATFPLIFELCVEISFPVNEASSGGTFIAFTAIVAVFSSEAITHVLDIDNQRDNTGMLYAVAGISILVLMEIIGTAAILLTKEDLRRTKFESNEHSVHEKDEYRIPSIVDNAKSVNP